MARAADHFPLEGTVSCRDAEFHAPRAEARPLVEAAEPVARLVGAVEAVQQDAGLPDVVEAVAVGAQQGEALPGAEAAVVEVAEPVSQPEGAAALASRQAEEAVVELVSPRAGAAGPP